MLRRKIQQDESDGRGGEGRNFRRGWSSKASLMRGCLNMELKEAREEAGENWKETLSPAPGRVSVWKNGKKTSEAGSSELGSKAREVERRLRAVARGQPG